MAGSSCLLIRTEIAHFVGADQSVSLTFSNAFRGRSCDERVWQNRSIWTNLEGSVSREDFRTLEANKLSAVVPWLPKCFAKKWTVALMSTPKTYSTLEAAKLIGVSVITLHRWLAAGKLRPFGIELSDGRKSWRWNDRDVAEGRKLKALQKRRRALSS